MYVGLALSRRLEMTHAWRSVKYARAQLVWRPETRSTVEAVAGGFAVFAGDGSPLNRAVGLGLHGPVTDTDLDHVEQLYLSRQATPRIDLCPLADPSLLALLREHNFLLERFFNVMARPLTNEDAAALAATPITQAAPEEAELWIRTTAQGFTGQDNPPQADLDILAPNFYSQDATCFFAWVDGQPAGGGTMFIHEGAAELGGASTRSAFRKRGVQTALLRARLAAARKAGCDLAASMTEPGSDSQRNMERAGFRLAYTKASMVKATTTVAPSSGI
jgi:GNAT superfamily N-acetyltransferase